MSKSRSRIEYLKQTNNIILHDSYFNLTINLISLAGDLIRFIDHLVWLTIFAPPCILAMFSATVGGRDGEFTYWLIVSWLNRV